MVNQEILTALKNSIESGESLEIAIKILINVCFVISLAIAVYGVPFIRYFIKKYRIEIVIFSLVSVGFYMITMLFQNLWMIFSTAISSLLYHVFKIFFQV